jgi:hypothetical protein
MTLEAVKSAVSPQSGQASDVQRKRLLEATHRFVPWPALLAILKPHWPVNDRKLMEPLLRIHLMRQWFHLSDGKVLLDIVTVPCMRFFSRIALLDKKDREKIIPGLIWLDVVICQKKLSERIDLVIDDALAEQGLLLKRSARNIEAFLVFSEETRRVRQEAKARSRFFVPLRYWSFQARLLGAMIAFQYAVMLAAPRDVLTRFPLLRGFVRAMEWVCGLVARKDNTITYLGRAARHPECAQLLAALMIAMLPLYLYCCYRWLGFDRQRNYRHFVISPYNREKVESSTDHQGWFIR